MDIDQEVEDVMVLVNDRADPERMDRREAVDFYRSLIDELKLLIDAMGE